MRVFFAASRSRKCTHCFAFPGAAGRVVANRTNRSLSLSLSLSLCRNEIGCRALCRRGSSGKRERHKSPSQDKLIASRRSAWRFDDAKQVMVQLTRVPTAHERETRRGVALYIMQHISRRTHPVPLPPRIPRFLRAHDRLIILVTYVRISAATFRVLL